MTYLCGFHSQAVLVDMEEGVVSELLSGPLGEVFDNQQLLTDVSGSGNNWWVGTRPSITHRYTTIGLIREKSSFLRETHVFIYNVAREGGERERIPLYLMPLC